MGWGDNRGYLFYGYLPYNTLMIVEEGRECRKAFEIRKICKGGTVGLELAVRVGSEAPYPTELLLLPIFYNKSFFLIYISIVFIL